MDLFDDPAETDAAVAKQGFVNAFGITVAFSLVFLIVNSIGTIVISESNLFSHFDEKVASFACGFLLAEACLLAIWAGAVRQKIIVRISCSMGILLVLSFSYMAVLFSLDGQLPMEVPLIFAGILLVLMLLIQFPLWLLKKRSSRSLTLGTHVLDRGSDSQFSIKHLLISTTIVAIVIAVIKATFPEAEFDGAAPWGEIIRLLLTFEMLTAILALFCFATVYLDGSRIVFGTALFATVLVGPWLVALTLGQMFGSLVSTNFSLVINTYAYAISLVVTIVAVLLVFRGIGYRWCLNQ